MKKKVGEKTVYYRVSELSLNEMLKTSLSISSSVLSLPKGNGSGHSMKNFLFAGWEAMSMLEKESLALGLVLFDFFGMYSSKSDIFISSSSDSSENGFLVFFPLLFEERVSLS